MSTENPEEFEVTKAVADVIPLGKSKLDVYMLPSGEYRLRIEATGIALGYTNRWFYNRTKRKSKWLEGLKRMGFNGAQKSLNIILPNERGSSIGRTISIRDFIKLVAYEAIIGKNLKAIILLALSNCIINVQYLTGLKFTGWDSHDISFVNFLYILLTFQKLRGHIYT